MLMNAQTLDAGGQVKEVVGIYCGRRVSDVVLKIYDVFLCCKLVVGSSSWY